MRQWMPSRRTLIAGSAFAVLIPSLNGILAAIDRVPYWAISLVVLTTLVVVLGGIAIFENIRRPYRVHILEGKELIDTIDSWLRDNGFTRGPAQWPGHSQGIIVTDNLRSVWIAKEDTSNKLIFISVRAEEATDTPSFNTIGKTEWAEKQYDLAIELARFGVFYTIEENPLTVLYWTYLAVDNTLNEAAVLEKVTLFNVPMPWCNY